jgi:CheY-like chemotaxis protein
MRILILDDDLTRHKTFARNLKDHDLTHVHTYDEAVKAARENEKFDVFFLDHDLNDFPHFSSVGPPSMYGGVRELTGEDFTRWITAKLPPAKLPNMVWIHSYNPDGAKRMRQTLTPLGIKIVVEPFHSGIGR